MSALRKINTSFGGKFVSTKYRTLAKRNANWVDYEEDGYLYSNFYFFFQVNDFFPVNGKYSLILQYIYTQYRTLNLFYIKTIYLSFLFLLAKT